MKTISNIGVHLMSPLCEEFSLCGYAFDNDDHPLVECGDDEAVTCEQCLEVIAFCKDY